MALPVIVVQLIWALVFAAISYALRPKTPDAKPAALEDVDAPTAEQGKPIPVLFGTKRMPAPNVTWYGDLDTSPIKKSSK